MQEGERLIQYLIDQNTLTVQFNNVNQLIDSICSVRNLFIHEESNIRFFFRNMQLLDYLT